MNAKIVGCGEPILVLSHGYGGSQSVWDDVLPTLSKRNRVLLFDWSFSSVVDPSISIFDSSKYSSLSVFADDLISLLDEMKLKDVVYVGHSMAGMIGCIASVTRPDLFSHLVLVGASPKYLNAEDYKGGFEREEVENMLTAIETNFTTWARSFGTLAMGTSDPAPAEKFCRSFLGMRPVTALSVARTVFLGDFRDILEKVEAPCMIVQGTNDIVVPVIVAHYMKSRVRGKARVKIIDGEGHFPQLTCPEMLVEIIEGVLGQRNSRDLVQIDDCCCTHKLGDV